MAFRASLNAIKIRITNERVVLKVLSDQQIKNHSKVLNEPDSSTWTTYMYKGFILKVQTTWTTNTWFIPEGPTWTSNKGYAMKVLHEQIKDLSKKS